MTEQTVPTVGQAVRVVTSDYRETFALVTAVHGTHDFPLINCVYVSNDETKRDSYGRQIERDLCSLNHVSGTKGMPKPGRYWEFIQ